jgi:eukaryotic-like serine/threonine-protein kinase
VSSPLPPSSNADPLIGSVLADRYEVIRRIGEGGMGAVYEGRHVVLRRQVAVKVLLEKFVEKTELVARLLQEARMASAIGHENIVDVTDFGTTVDGRAFVVMEFLEGEALAALVMREAPLAVDRCLRIARQVVSALGAAHGKGIVHRDVKPENVFLQRRGEQDFIKVVDFGVSKAVRSRDEGAELTRLTRTGMVLGTPLYMSPEQARGGEDVDARADIWAVGVMLYECLTGEVPFRANNYLGVISQVLTQEIVPPSRLRPELGIPPAVEAVVMRAMAKDRNDRYQDMAALERDLDRLLAGDANVGLGEAPVAAPAPLPHRTRWHLGIAGILVVGVGLSLALVRTEEERRRVVVPLTAPRSAKPMQPVAPAVVPPAAPQPLPVVDDADPTRAGETPPQTKVGAPPAAPIGETPNGMPEAKEASARRANGSGSRSRPGPPPAPASASPPGGGFKGGDQAPTVEDAYPRLGKPQASEPNAQKRGSTAPPNADEAYPGARTQPAQGDSPRAR